MICLENSLVVDSLKSAYIRRNMRLKDYDYSQDGANFITIVTQNRACLFGSIIEGKWF